MHRDRNNGTWPELKAKRHNKFDDAPLESLHVMHSNLDGGIHGIQKVKKDRAAKQFSQVQSMFKDMVDYDNKQHKLA